MGNIHLNEKHSISTRSLERVIDILKDKFNLLVSYPDLISNKEFMGGTCNNVGSRIRLFQEYLDFVFNKKKQKLIYGNKKELTFNRLKCVLFNQKDE